MMIVDIHGNVLFINKQLEDLLNLTRKSYVGQNLLDIMPSKEIIFHNLNDNKYCNKVIDWSKKSLQTFRSPITHENNVIGALFIFQDITTLQQMENKIEDLESNNRELSLALDHSFDGIVVVDGDGTLAWVNKGYEKLVGMNAKKYIGWKMEDLIKEGIISESVSLLAINAKKTVTISQEIDGIKEILVTGTPIINGKGEVSLVITNARDVTELNCLREKKEKYLAEVKELRAKETRELEEIIIRSSAMEKAVHEAIKASKFESNVLITGESGTGKEVIAKIIHDLSNLKEMPFIKINCGAIPDNLLESELFGYEKGAFTGASSKGKVGLFEMAKGGTVLLDEISELPLNLQVKILRVLQEQEMYRVGGTNPITLNFRVIATSNKDVFQLVSEGLFREDLYYRLNVIPIHLPPLRERTEDIVPMVNYFLNKLNEHNLVKKKFDPEVIEKFELYNWPGNIRELKNMVERLFVLSEDDTIAPDLLPVQMKDKGIKNEKFIFKVQEVMPLNELRDQAEKILIEKALEQCSSIRQAARALGIQHSTLIQKIKKFNLSYPNKN